MNSSRKSLGLSFAGIALMGVSSSFAATLTNTPLVAVNPDPGQISGFLAPGATSSGAVATWNVTTGTNQYMNVRTDFEADMSNVGDKTVVRFDFVLGQDVPNDEGADFRFTIFDTVAGAEMIQLVRLGNQGGFNSSMLRSRFDTDLSSPTAFNNGGGTIGGAIYAPGGTDSSFGLPLWKAGDVHTFTTTVERLSADTLSYSVLWENAAGSSLFSIPSYNETSGAGAFDGTDAWPGGKVNQFNGFAITIFSADPFSQDGLPGSGTFSNFSVTGTPVPEPTAGLLGICALSSFLIRRRRMG
jgi:hypothetical protein